MAPPSRAIAKKRQDNFKQNFLPPTHDHSVYASIRLKSFKLPY